jgi:uridine kinase
VDTDADIRLARRLERDIEERGRTMTSVIAQYFTTVRPMHLEFVEPSKGYADVVIRDGFTPEAVEAVIEMIRSHRARDFDPDV